MKAIGVTLFLLLLVPIYALPWIAGLFSFGTMVVAGAEGDSADVDGMLATLFGVTVALWLIEAFCYAVLVGVTLIFAGGARWVAALVALAGLFDTMPVMDWIPFVPSALLITAFVVMAKAQTHRPSPPTEA